MAQMTEGDWKGMLEAGWDDKYGPIGDVFGAIKELVNAVVAAFQGDFGPLGDLVEGALVEFADALQLDNIIEAIRKGVTGGSLPGGNPLGDLFDDIFGLRNKVDDQGAGISDLQDKTQELIGVIGYACRYMSTSPGVNTSPATMPFNTQVGRVVGATLLSGGRTRLDSQGLWRFEAQVHFASAKWAPPQCYMDIVIRNAAGVEFERLKAMQTSDSPLTITNVMPMVIPAAGYTAEVQAWTSGLPLFGSSWRTLSGGLNITRFSCFKISDETS